MGRTYIRRDGDRRPQTGYRRIRFYVPRWTDPYFFVQGSVPEKMVIGELVRRGIWFEHTPQTNSLGGLVDPSWEPDFLFTQYRIWLEVQGFYFHTLPGQPEADAYRFAAIEAAGWKVIYWWDFDILARLPELMDAVPEFYRVDPSVNRGKKTNNGLDFWEGGTGIDHLKGLRAALRARARAPQYRSNRRGNDERHAK